LAASLLLCCGCVARDDYLRKTAEAGALASQVETLATENAALTERMRHLTSENDALVAQRQGLLAERETLTRDREALSARFSTQSAEASQAIQRLTRRTAELEGDVQMLQESIALLRKNKEEEMRVVSTTYEKLITEMREEVRTVSAACEDLIKEVEEETQAFSVTYEDLLTEMAKEVEGGKVAVSELKGKLTLSVAEESLFRSGQAEVRPEGLALLGRIADILRTDVDRTVRIEGHTDNVPIKGTLARKYPSNWELSAARAVNVVRFLEKKGLDPFLLSAAAFGGYRPVADNKTPEGRAKNRRIVIILLPKEQEADEPAGDREAESGR
jgi:chemotaxis protein MotB